MGMLRAASPPRSMVTCPDLRSASSNVPHATTSRIGTTTKTSPDPPRSNQRRVDRRVGENMHRRSHCIVGLMRLVSFQVLDSSSRGSRLESSGTPCDGHGALCETHAPGAVDPSLPQSNWVGSQNIGASDPNPMMTHHLSSLSPIMIRHTNNARSSSSPPKAFVSVARLSRSRWNSNAFNQRLKVCSSCSGRSVALRATSEF